MKGFKKLNEEEIERKRGKFVELQREIRESIKKTERINEGFIRKRKETNILFSNTENTVYFKTKS